MKKAAGVLMLTIWTFLPLKADLTPYIGQFVCKQDMLLINTNIGMYQLRLEGDTIYWRQFPSSVNNPNLSNLFEDNDGNLWAVSTNEWNPDLGMIQQFGGSAWKQYLHPSLGGGTDFRFFNYRNQTCLMLYESARKLFVFYRFTDDNWSEFARVEVDMGKYLNPSVDQRNNFKLQTIGDTIRFSGRLGTDNSRVMYTYTADSGKWAAAYGYSLEDKPLAWIDTRKWDYTPIENEHGSLTGIVSPTGDTLAVKDTHTLQCHTFDKAGNLYICLIDYTGDEGAEATFYSCVNGKWSVLNQSKNYIAQHLTFQDSANRLWSAASDYPTPYVGYFEDGRWIEIAVLPPVSEGGMDEESEPAESLFTAVINDRSSHAFVRSKPEDNAPVVALMLNKVSFTAENVSDGWCHVRINSGLTGYVRKSDIYDISH